LTLPVFLIASPNLPIDTFPVITQPIDTIPPIRKTFESDGIWYDFHEKRIFNLNKKMQIYKAIERSYIEALAVRDQALANKLYSDSIALAQQVEINTIKRLVADKNDRITNLSVELLQEKERSKALIAEAKQKRKTHIKWFSSSTALAIIATAAFILK